MRRTPRCPKPVVCLLSSSIELAKRSQEILHSIFHLEITTGCDDNASGEFSDDLDQAFALPIPGVNKLWRSIGMKCPKSGSVVHLLSPESAGHSIREKDSLSLLAVADVESHNDIMSQTRKQLAGHLQKLPFGSCSGLAIRHMLGSKITASILSKGALPLLFLNEEHTCVSESTRNGLKEVCIPCFDGARYDDGSTLLTRLASSTLARPATGLYQFANGLVVRPLPSAPEDRILPPTSLVFHCDDVEEASQRVENAGARIAKIGFSGTSRHGQLIVNHTNLRGLDIRLDPSEHFHTHFAESQDSLLAGSLEELQSANVLVEGGRNHGSQAEPTRPDSLNGLGDCWVEFRANMKRPSGYFKRKDEPSGRPPVAKAPNLPFE